jgi:hypothetical protein
VHRGGERKSERRVKPPPSRAEIEKSKIESAVQSWWRAESNSLELTAKVAGATVKSIARYGRVTAIINFQISVKTATIFSILL